MTAGRSTSTKPLTAKQQAAWRAFVRALTVAPRVLDADLLEASRLKHRRLSRLGAAVRAAQACAADERAAQATLTRRGLTRVVERLTRRGLVERTRSQSDGRGQVARLTKDWMRALVKAYPAHLHSVRTRIMRHLRRLDLAAFTDAMDRIAEEA